MGMRPLCPLTLGQGSLHVGSRCPISLQGILPILWACGLVWFRRGQHATFPSWLLRLPAWIREYFMTFQGNLISSFQWCTYSLKKWCGVTKIKRPYPGMQAEWPFWKIPGHLLLAILKACDLFWFGSWRGDNLLTLLLKKAGLGLISYSNWNQSSSALGLPYWSLSLPIT